MTGEIKLSLKTEPLQRDRAPASRSLLGPTTAVLPRRDLIFHSFLPAVQGKQHMRQPQALPFPGASLLRERQKYQREEMLPVLLKVRHRPQERC